MKTGDIVLIPFPFSELTNVKLRPAVVVCATKDKYQDIVLCAISSVVPLDVNPFEIALSPNSTNKLRAPSIIKVDRIATLKQSDIVTVLGALSESEADVFKKKFKLLVD